MGKYRFSGEPGNELILIESRLRFQRIFRARVQKKYGKDIYKKGLPQCLCFNDTILFFSASKFVLSFRKKAFFFYFFLLLLQLDLWWQPHSSVARLFSGKIIDNHSSINMDFTWLVTWSGFKRF